MSVIAAELADSLRVSPATPVIHWTPTPEPEPPREPLAHASAPEPAGSRSRAVRRAAPRLAISFLR